MTLHNVDAARFDYLLRSSFTPSQLQEFFAKQRRVLMVAHERVQNLPSDLIAAIRRFSPQAHAVMRSWLAAQPLENPVADDQLVPRFRSVEEFGVKLSASEATHLAASALRALYRDQPPVALLEFLRAPITVRHAPKAKDVEVALDIPQEDWEALLNACTGTAPPQRIMDPTLRAAVTIILATQNANAAESADELAAAPRRALQKHLDKQLKLAVAAAPPRGIVSSPLPYRAFDPNFDYTRAEVVAGRVRATFKQDIPWFAVGEAFILGNEIFSMSDGELRAALPSSGDVVIHRNRGMSEPPLNEPQVYEFEVVDTPFPSKALATAVVDRLLPVVFIPCSSSDAPQIRDFIAEYAKHATHKSAVFVTTDHLCLRPRRVSLSAVNVPGNEWVMECWPHLTAHELSTGTYVLAPLPPSSQFLDCGPLAIVARRVLAQLKAKGELPLSKAAIAAIADQLANETSAFSAMTKERLLHNLHAIESSGDEYQQLVGALLGVPQIAQDIAERSQRAVEERLALVATEKLKIDNLRRQAADLEASNRELENERANAVKELRLAIRKAFIAATKREIAVLGDISLLTALVPGMQPPLEAAVSVTTSEYSTPPTALRITSQVVDKSDVEIEQTLSMLGLEPTTTLAACQVVSAIAGTGVFVVLEEVSEVGVQLARSLSRTRVRILDVPIGLIQPSIDAAWLTEADVDVLLLQNANLSDLAVYGSTLISLVTRRLTGLAKSRPPTIILTGCASPAAVSWPFDIDPLAIRITLGSLEQAIATSSRNQEVGAKRTPMQRLLDRAVERQADKMELTNDVRDALRYLIRPTGVGT